MSAKRPQTFAKRARELAVKERRDLKRARKAEAAAQRAAGDAAGGLEPSEGSDPTTDPEGGDEDQGT